MYILNLNKLKKLYFNLKNRINTLIEKEIKKLVYQQNKENPISKFNNNSNNTKKIEVINLINSNNLLNDPKNRQLFKLMKKKKKFQNRIKLINYFIKTKSQPTWMSIKYLPVLPPNLRPIINMTGKQSIVSDLNQLYEKIIYYSNRIKELKKFSTITENQIRRENYKLQEVVSKLIGNKENVAKEDL